MLTKVNLNKCYTIQHSQNSQHQQGIFLGMKFNNYYLIFLEKVQNVINNVPIFQGLVQIYLHSRIQKQKKRYEQLLKRCGFRRIIKRKKRITV
ncbi:unnamed protein product [Paramecium pentaurelia]|uniref:Uncharacterized protein n=1 Tax=Paramecium pentaurelia TaxID=43138 RepID=A0A8S1UUW8_9CILI|nr:unnamed protein product [Paramecium pentaurelia]